MLHANGTKSIYFSALWTLCNNMRHHGNCVFSDYESGGQGFESLRARQCFQRVSRDFESSPATFLPSASRRDPDDRNASVQKINDWFGGLRRGSENNFVARQKYCRAAGSHATFTRQVKLANASVGKPRAGWEFQALAKHRSHGLLDSRVRGKRHGVSSRTFRFPDYSNSAPLTPRTGRGNDLQAN